MLPKAAKTLKELGMRVSRALGEAFESVFYMLAPCGVGGETDLQSCLMDL